MQIEFVLERVRNALKMKPWDLPIVFEQGRVLTGECGICNGRIGCISILLQTNVVYIPNIE